MNAIALTGLRAENPLAFLATLGTLSLLHEAMEQRPRISWEQRDGTWLPQLHADNVASPDELLKTLVGAHCKRDLESELGWEKDVMKVTREGLREQLRSREVDSESARLLAALLAELPPRRDKETVYYTPFRLMPRVGRAKFLEVALRESRHGVAHLRSCLFESWAYTPDTQSMRWDPAAPVPARALMAEAPTDAKPHGVPGAILLAIRGLASFPLITQRYSAVPAGMVERTGFTWPIWRDPLQLPVIRMLLSIRWLYELDETHRNSDDSGSAKRRQQPRPVAGRRRREPADVEAQLRAHSVIATFTAPRVRRGQDDEALGWGVPWIIGEPSSENSRMVLS